MIVACYLFLCRAAICRGFDNYSVSHTFNQTQYPMSKGLSSGNIRESEASRASRIYCLNAIDVADLYFDRLGHVVDSGLPKHDDILYRHGQSICDHVPRAMDMSA
jgi:hypothetical protein